MKALYLTALFLMGCKAHAPHEDLMYDAHQRVEYKTEKKDVWVRGCPTTGDCEDIVLCMFDDLERKGKKPELLVCGGYSHLPKGVGHAFLKDGEWYYDPTNLVSSKWDGLDCPYVAKLYSYEEVVKKSIGG